MPGATARLQPACYTSRVPASTRGAARRRIARREAWEWAVAFGWPAVRVLALGTALAIAVTIVVWQATDPRGERAALGPVIAAGARWGLGAALPLALWVGSSTLVRRLARAWALVPLVSIPLAVGGSLYLCSGVLHARAEDVIVAVNGSLDARGLSTLAGLAGPPTRPLGRLPSVFGEAGEAFFDPPARAALDALTFEIGAAIAMGFVPALVVSMVALAIGYRRGFERRHEADLERLRAPRDA